MKPSPCGEVSDCVQSQTHDDTGMKLLVMADSFLPHAGGSRVYYYSLYRHLTEQFPDRVTVLTKKVPGWKEFDARSSDNALRIIRRFRPLPNWKYQQLPKLIPSLAQAACFVLSHRVDMVHAGDLFPQGVIAMWLKQTLGVPYLTYCHGEEITQTDYRRFQPRVRNAVYVSSDAVIAANGFARANLLRIGVPAQRIFTVLPGVDSERFSPRPPRPELVRQFGLQGKLTILSVGRLVERKGHSMVLRALARIRHSIPPFQYLIVGEGPEKAAIAALARELGLSEQVILAGKAQDQQLADIYNLSDLFVLANRVVAGDLEGFGMVFLEANAAGKAVLGGRTGGTSEAVVDGSTGMLVDPESVEEIAGALQLLLTNADLRQRFADAGLRRARAEFCWPLQARRLREVCLQVLRQRGWGAAIAARCLSPEADGKRGATGGAA
ncbi:MAG TPA: glycosyltransferase family 4 protein [Candidatus Bathyarchaeia archaeon]|nr:glycosyltransferase family 4 protein [Candidatus Bathyarchaeia archaeon]